MHPAPDHDEKLERLIHRTLRELPLRKAPRSLEARVLAELERRAALPWWRKSFVHWPMAARAAFVLSGSAAAASLVWAVVSAQAGFNPAVLSTFFAREIGWLESGVALFSRLSEFTSLVFNSIPPLWLYGGIAFVASLYLALFGLGAAAYRTLYANR